jgi:hypothetical protein
MMIDKTATAIISVAALFPSITAVTNGDFMGALAPLIQVGAVGAILAWFLVKHEPRMRAIEFELQTQSRAILLSTLANPHASEQIREAATELKDEVEARIKESKK